MKKLLLGIGYAALTLGIYLGIFLLGWGITDLRGFFSNSARTWFALFIACLSLMGILIPFILPGGIGGAGEETDTTRKHQKLWAIFRPFLFFVLFAMPFCDNRDFFTLPELQAMRWIGLVLIIPGMLIVYGSTIALGRQYSVYITVQKEHHLVTAGLYRYVRNPRYSGVLLAALGLALLFRSWIGLIAFPFLLALLVYRLKDEELLLKTQFGREWDEYARHSWRLVPFIW